MSLIREMLKVPTVLVPGVSKALLVLMTAVMPMRHFWHHQHCGTISTRTLTTFATFAPSAPYSGRREWSRTTDLLRVKQAL